MVCSHTRMQMQQQQCLFSWAWMCNAEVHRETLQVLGDSLMRQLFSRLVHMLRGHSRAVDYKMHTHASYSICQVLAFSTIVHPCCCAH